MRLNVLIAGQEAAGAQILRILLGSQHRVVAVLTQDPTTVGESASLSPLAARAGIEVLPAALVKDASFADRVRAWDVDLLLNVHSLHIVADSVLSAPRIGAFNLHPGPLPSYAGLHTPSWAIYNGETEHAVTVHWMHPDIDTGPIAFEERFPIPSNATALVLAAECSKRGVALLERLVERAEAGAREIPRVHQDPSARVYYPRRRIPQDGVVDWDRPAEQVARFARAFDYGPFTSPWGRPVATIAGKRFEVLGLDPTDGEADAPAGAHRLVGGALQVACSDRWIVVRHLFENGARVANDVVDDRIRALEESSAHPSSASAARANI